VLGPAGGGALAVVSLLLPLYLAPALAALLTFAQNLFLIAAAFAVLALGLGLAIPGFTAAPTLLVGPERQGAISGLVNATIGATFIVGPLLSTALYEIRPEIPILAALAASLAALALVWLSPAARHIEAPVPESL
jgi:hypothetical protein